MTAVGRDKSSPTADLVDDYLDRAAPLGRGLGIDGPTLNVVEAPKALRGSERQAREAGLLLDAVPPGEGIILLDERGKNLTSRALADRIARSRDSGVPGLRFLIGGADGFGGDLSVNHPRVEGAISFGAAVWPHMLCRVMLAEQLYRALTILAGHPYHRD